MGELVIATLQNELRGPNAPAAWEAFLREYSPFLYQVARAYSEDDDEAAECFVNICEQLAKRSFRRLLQFKPDGTASFTTWIRVVCRNLCFDWHRRQTGRRRYLKPLQSMAALDIQVYRSRFEDGLSTEQTLERLRPAFPELCSHEVVEAEERIQRSLTSRQQWILSRRKVPTISLLNDNGEEELATLPDRSIDLERTYCDRERQTHLQANVARLSADEQRLLRLRFENDLSFQQIARVARLGDAQRAHRHLSAILHKLRAAME